MIIFNHMKLMALDFCSLFGLACGNNGFIQYHTPAYSKKITIAIATVYLVAFSIGLFFGDLFSDHEFELEKTIGLISTIITYTLATSILRSSIKNHRFSLLELVVSTVVVTQTAMIFNLISSPMENIFYYLGSVITLIFAHGLSHSGNPCAEAIKD